jgi:hypothetical protein
LFGKRPINDITPVVLVLVAVVLVAMVVMGSTIFNFAL